MSSLSGIKAISFDVDGTLQDFDGMMHHALREVLKELAQLDTRAAQALDVEMMIAIRDEVHERLRGRVTDLDAVRKESIKQALCEKQGGLTMRWAHTWHRYTSGTATEREFSSQTFALPWNCFVRATGSACCPTATAMPGDLGLGSLISFEVFSQDNLGIEKPDPRIFEIAFHVELAANLVSSCTWGTRWRTTLPARRAAGSKAIWLNRNSDARDGGTEPAFEIRSLLELDRILRQ